MFLSLTKSMILWHNTKLKTIGAIMSTGCCRFCSAAVLSVLSVQCLYLPHSSVFTHLQIHPLLADSVLPCSDCGQNAAAKTNNYPSAHSALCALPFIFWTDFTKPVPAENATQCATYQPQPARQNYHVSHHSKSPPDASVSISVFSSAFISGDFSHALKNGRLRPILS